jgi:hypothetical protein
MIKQDKTKVARENERMRDQPAGCAPSDRAATDETIAIANPLSRSRNSIMAATQEKKAQPPALWKTMRPFLIGGSVGSTWRFSSLASVRASISQNPEPLKHFSIFEFIDHIQSPPTRFVRTRAQCLPRAACSRST